MCACPVCAGEEYSVLADARTVDDECRIRERFIRDRLAHPARPEQLKDLTNFFHAGRAKIVVCSECSLLIRREIEPPPERTYSAEQYDTSAIQVVYPQYLAAFRAKEQSYRPLLPPDANILEIGSHYGAFLQTAQEWGWSAEGVDIGADTSRFARSNGFNVHTKELPECGIPDASREAVFIWNCFEQIADPTATLGEARRILKPGGLLVVRTPNGLFYSMCHVLIGQTRVHSGAKDLLVKAMAYNNLLGFPYLYGHSQATLNRLIERFGFRFENGLNSELITLPLPDSPQWVEQQERDINDEIRLLSGSILADTHGILTGPWIELWYRRTESKSDLG